MPFDRSKYPANWNEISLSIRRDRAGWQCEFVENGERCQAKHLQPHPITGSKVVLTTAHLKDPNPMNCAPDNLAAYCQLHHFRYDAPRRKTKTYIYSMKPLSLGGALVHESTDVYDDNKLCNCEHACCTHYPCDNCAYCFGHQQSDFM